MREGSRRANPLAALKQLVLLISANAINHTVWASISCSRHYSDCCLTSGAGLRNQLLFFFFFSPQGCLTGNKQLNSSVWTPSPSWQTAASLHQLTGPARTTPEQGRRVVPVLILPRDISARRSAATASRRAAAMRGQSSLKPTECERGIIVTVCQIFVPAVLEKQNSLKKREKNEAH